jgi:DNA-binding response OmpR family regulator
MALDPQTKVFYVAKDDALRAVRTQALREAGFDVCEASTCGEVASVNEKVDLILVSVDLPDWSGFEVCRRLRMEPDLAAIPVILLSTTFAEAADRLQALDAGADDYLTEPVEPAELLKAIRNHLLVRRRESSSEISPQQ